MLASTDKLADDISAVYQCSVQVERHLLPSPPLFLARILASDKQLISSKLQKATESLAKL